MRNLIIQYHIHCAGHVTRDAGKIKNQTTTTRNPRRRSSPRQMPQTPVTRMHAAQHDPSVPESRHRCTAHAVFQKHPRAPPAVAATWKYATSCVSQWFVQGGAASVMGEGACSGQARMCRASHRVKNADSLALTSCRYQRCAGLPTWRGAGWPGQR